MRCNLQELYHTILVALELSVNPTDDSKAARDRLRGLSFAGTLVFGVLFSLITMLQSAHTVCIAYIFFSTSDVLIVYFVLMLASINFTMCFLRKYERIGWWLGARTVLFPSIIIFSFTKFRHCSTWRNILSAIAITSLIIVLRYFRENHEKSTDISNSLLQYDRIKVAKLICFIHTYVFTGILLYDAFSVINCIANEVLKVVRWLLIMQLLEVV